MDACRGITLTELLSVVAIVALLGTLTVPSMAHLQQNAARTAAVNDFFHALFFARSEAIKRGQIVSLCGSLDGRTCDSGIHQWREGWIVFVNADRDEPAQRDENEPVLMVYEGWRNGSIASNRRTYSFRPHVQAVVNGTIVFCDARGSEHARAIIISHTGRPRISKRDASGRALKC